MELHSFSILERQLVKRLVRERTQKVEVANNWPRFRTWWKFQWAKPGFKIFWEVKKGKKPCYYQNNQRESIHWGDETRGCSVTGNLVWVLHSFIDKFCIHRGNGGSLQLRHDN